MKFLKLSALLYTIFILVACNQNGPLPQVNNGNWEQTKALKDVVTTVSELTEKISSREESINKLVENMSAAKKPENKEEMIQEGVPETSADASTTPSANLSELVVIRNEQAIKNIIHEMAHSKNGIEKIATSIKSGINSEDFNYLIKIIQSLLPKETYHFVLAHIFYQALSDEKPANGKVIAKALKGLSPEQKKQIIGYALFINASNSENNKRELILEEAVNLGINPKFFNQSMQKINDLKADLDAVVTGQENAKIGLAVAISNHYQRLEKGLKKSNLLIIGPSGTGKTFMVETIAKSLDVPFVVADASDITQAGYVGGKVKDAVAALAQKANYKQEEIEKGIIFFDELDKMAARGGKSGAEEFKRQAQATLLKIIEGVEVEIEVNKFTKITVNTEKILIVCAGAFTGLAQLIENRLLTENKTVKDNIYAQITNSDLIGYGIMPELLGRLPNVLTLQKLKTNDFVNILGNPRASILDEYKNIFKSQNIDLQFTKEAVQAIAEIAGSYEIGARGLRTVVETVMSDLQFRISSMGNIVSCVVTERVVRYGDLPIITLRSST